MKWSVQRALGRQHALDVRIHAHRVAQGQAEGLRVNGPGVLLQRGADVDRHMGERVLGEQRQDLLPLLRAFIADAGFDGEGDGQRL